MKPWIPISLDRGDAMSMHRQIHEQIRGRILSGQLVGGDRLPGSRRLAVQLNVSRTVVTTAYDLLMADGFIESQSGSGTRVARGAQPIPVDQLPAVAPPLVRRAPGRPAGPEVRYDFRPGGPAWDLFPRRLWSRGMASATDRLSAQEVGYGPAEGAPQLRRALSHHLRLHRGVSIRSRDIVITSGATQALDLVARAVLRPDDAVVVEEPTHPVLREIFHNHRCRVVPVEVDDEGIRVDLITAAVEKAGTSPDHVRFVYSTPSHQFPTGVTTSLARRLALLAWAREHGTLVIEDDYDSEYVPAERRTSAMTGLDPEHAVYIGTFSKSLFPGVRLGFAGLPAGLVEPVVQQKYLSDRLSPVIEQHVIAELLSSGNFQRHVARMREAYAERRAVLVEELAVRFGDAVQVDGPPAGLHAVIHLDVPLSARELAQRCRARQVGVYPADDCYAGAAPTRPTLLMGYAAMTPAEVRAGLDVLADVVRAASAEDGAREARLPC